MKMYTRTSDCSFLPPSLVVNETLLPSFNPPLQFVYTDHPHTHTHTHTHSHTSTFLQCTRQNPPPTKHTPSPDPGFHELKLQ